jgi:hypothetical protein
MITSKKVRTRPRVLATRLVSDPIIFFMTFFSHRTQTKQIYGRHLCQNDASHQGLAEGQKKKVGPSASSSLPHPPTVLDLDLGLWFALQVAPLLPAGPALFGLSRLRTWGFRSGSLRSETSCSRPAFATLHLIERITITRPTVKARRFLLFSRPVDRSITSNYKESI